MTRKAGGYHQARRKFGRIDYRQRVRRHIDEAAPGACNRRLGRDRKHLGDTIHDAANIGCRRRKRALCPFGRIARPGTGAAAEAQATVGLLPSRAIGIGHAERGQKTTRQRLGLNDVCDPDR